MYDSNYAARSVAGQAHFIAVLYCALSSSALVAAAAFWPSRPPETRRRSMTNPLRTADTPAVGIRYWSGKCRRIPLKTADWQTTIAQ